MKVLNLLNTLWVQICHLEKMLCMKLVSSQPKSALGEMIRPSANLYARDLEMIALQYFHH
jgi:hypothetical protein